ncbi:riboflavin synthase [Nannocystis pusilla]|uniref:Riboflavin synthase n=1 Tax=Nannocystis pusilla TaxID=889268 RepID=A0A9X3ENK0_9BACT|nr:riboflavin synthase [Nannocystis pusilla]MCY1007367.1 riboflavin synthase [Nannocystis pusilla]
MFTGLVRGVGTVERVIPGAQRRTFVIAYALSEGDRSLGASVAISGVCLTVVASTARDFTVEAAFETLAVTTLGDLRPGSRVHLEPALRLGDALGGHLVAGHVDGLARVRSRVARGDALECGSTCRASWPATSRSRAACVSTASASPSTRSTPAGSRSA